jgi:predicted ArsR family transcriptional regulator
LEDDVSDQFDLFEHGRHRRHDPDTSVAAARSTDATRLEALVIEALTRYGPQTTEELANRLQLAVVTVSPRMVPLEEKLVVERTPERRRGLSGRPRIVWALT